MHPRYAPFLVGFLLSGFMSCLVARIATFRSAGLVPNFHAVWMLDWLIAFPPSSW